MHIVINESQERLLIERYIVPHGMHDRLKRVNDEKMELENYIEKNGEYMTDITNGKVYLVQYLRALSELVGREYAVCAPVRQDGTYGAFYVKPWKSFRKNYSVALNRNASPVSIKKNLYQQMNLNK